MADEHGRIASRNVLAVEGDDERNFFDKLLHHVGIVDFDIRCVGGKNQFKKNLSRLRRGLCFAASVAVLSWIAFNNSRVEET